MPVIDYFHTTKRRRARSFTIARRGNARRQATMAVDARHRTSTRFFRVVRKAGAVAKGNGHVNVQVAVSSSSANSGAYRQGSAAVAPSPATMPIREIHARWFAEIPIILPGKAGRCR